MPKAMQKLEIAGLTLKAKLGLLHENQLVKLKTRTFHTADGGVRREKILMEVVNGRLEREATVTKTRSSEGVRRGGIEYDGNLRRGPGKVGIPAAFADPDFQAAINGNKAAVARFNARQEARNHLRENGQAVPHTFVNARGERVVLKKSSDLVLKE